MPQAGLSEVLAYLRKTCAIKAARDLSDAELLKRFVADREEAAFSALVRRHGPMVLSVCRRVLGDAHSAEDAFQATFMVLVRRIAAVSQNRPLANWLYGVAQRIALKARTQDAGRRHRERQVADMPRTEPLDELTWQELRAVLDEEIGRLPEKLRTPIVLCYFEGKSHDEAARELGWPKRSLTSRLAKARELLRDQLSRRGITLSAGVLSAVLSEKTAGAAVGVMLTINTVKAAMSIAAGKAVATGMLSAKAIILAEEGMKATIGMGGKFKILMLMFGLAAGVAGVAGYGGWSDRATVLAVPAASKTPSIVGKDVTQKGMEKDAEKFFREMEKKFREAKSLKVAYEFSAEFDGKKLKGKGTSYFAEGNKTRVDMDASDGDKLLQLSMVSDGEHLFLHKSDSPDPDAVATPSHLNATTTGVLARLGGFFAAMWFEPGNAAEKVDLEREIAVSEFKLGGNEKIGKQDAQLIEFALIVERFDGAKLQAKLWIDPKTSAPLKRQITMTVIGEGTATFTDVYSEFTVNPKLDGKLFELPAGIALPKPTAPKLSIPIKGNASGKVSKAADAIFDRYGDALPADALARLGALTFRHGGSVSALACSPDGKLLATSNPANAGPSRVCIWDASTGKALHRIVIPTSGVVLAFAPDGKTLLTETSIINVATGKELVRIGSAKPAFVPAVLSPDAKTLVRVDQLGDTGRVMLIDVATAKEIRRFEFSGILPAQNWASLSRPIISPDGKVLATGNQDNSIRLWDMATGKDIRRLEGHEKAVINLAFAANGKYLASSACEEGVVLVWDVEKGKVVNRIQVSGQYATLLFSPEGNLFITDLLNAAIHDPMTGKELRRWVMHPFTSSVVFSADCKTLISASHLGSAIHRWDIATGKEIEPFDLHVGAITALHFTPDGKTLFSGGADRKIHVWDLANRQPLDRGFTGPLGPDKPGEHRGMAGLAPVGKIMAVWVQKLGETGAAAQKWPVINLYDGETGKELHTLRQGEIYFTATFSPDGKLVTTVGNDGMRLWDVATGKALDLPQLVQVKEGSKSAFSPNSKALAIRDDRTVRLIDIAARKELRSWEHHQSEVYAFEFSPDGKTIASAGLGSIVIWAADTGKKLQLISVNKGRLRNLVFSPSGRYLATWEQGEAVHLCDVFSGEKFCEIHTTQGLVGSAAFSPDGRTLATGGGDSTILLWDLTGHAGNKAAPLTAAEVDSLWADLGGDAVKADAAIWALAFGARESISALKKRLKPVAPADAQQFAKLVTDLGSEQFATRQKASLELDKLGEPAEAQLRKVLAGKITLELRQRIEQILEKRDKDPEVIRRLRAVETVEHIGTAGASELLELLAKEAPNPRVGEAAAAALARLAKRS